jgi:CRP-like cAMP-binding protein
MVPQLELLRNMPIFGGLKSETLEFVLGQSSEVLVAEHDYFFREGDKGESVYVLQSGRAQVQRLKQGLPIVLRHLSDGDCFGEMSLIDFMPRSASVMALSPCQAMEIPGRSLIQLYKRDVEQYAVIMMNLGREVSRRLRLAGDRLFQLEESIDQPME